jgi:hypothetical protein
MSGWVEEGDNDNRRGRDKGGKLSVRNKSKMSMI